MRNVMFFLRETLINSLSSLMMMSQDKYNFEMRIVIHPTLQHKHFKHFLGITWERERTCLELTLMNFTYDEKLDIKKSINKITKLFNHFAP